MSVILQIVPRRSVIPDGIGDFATRLAEGLIRGHAIGSVFLQAASRQEAEPRADKWPTHALELRSGNELRENLDRLVAALRPNAILLHVSGYGYHRRGVPTWLADGLDRHRGTNAKFRPGLIGFLHELWVGSHARPWTSSFWLRGSQRSVTRRLFALCDRAITTNSSYRAMLAALPEATREPPVDLLPVFSNVGEPARVARFEQRPPRLAVFAGAGTGNLVRNHGAALSHFLRVNRIREIADIGNRREALPATVGEVAVRACGRLPAEAVSDLLGQCRFGVLPYSDRPVLGKSGTLAAYAAHGVVPVAFDTRGEDADGLIAGRHYVIAGAPAAGVPEQIPQRIHQWYAGHNVAAHAGLVAGMLADLKAGPTDQRGASR